MSLDDLPTRAPQPTESEPVVPRVDRPSSLVDKVTRAEELRLQLADEIVRGTLPPGAGLDETDLARRFNVSRTPVRIAARWWRGPRWSGSPACSRRWPSWRRCAPALPRNA